MDFLPLLLKTAGFRRSGAKRRSCRSKRWSKSAQALFTSWAVLGQMGGMSLLVAEVIEPKPALADITDIPGSSSSGGGQAGTSTGTGSFAIGIGATTGDAFRATASGYEASAVGDGATAIGACSTASGY